MYPTGHLAQRRMGGIIGLSSGTNDTEQYLLLSGALSEWMYCNSTITQNLVIKRPVKTTDIPPAVKNLNFNK
jgi:hypothetical protein